MEPSPYRAPSAPVADYEREQSGSVTWAQATKVWWGLMWRAILFGGLAGGAFGMVMGGILGALGTPIETIRMATSWIGIFVGIPVGIWVVRNVLQKSWSDFRIVLVPLDRN